MTANFKKRFNYWKKKYLTQTFNTTYALHSVSNLYVVALEGHEDPVGVVRCSLCVYFGVAMREFKPVITIVLSNFPINLKVFLYPAERQEDLVAFPPPFNGVLIIDQTVNLLILQPWGFVAIEASCDGGGLSAAPGAMPPRSAAGPGHSRRLQQRLGVRDQRGCGETGRLCRRSIGSRAAPSPGWRGRRWRSKSCSWPELPSNAYSHHTCKTERGEGFKMWCLQPEMSVLLVQSPGGARPAAASPRAHRDGAWWEGDRRGHLEDNMGFSSFPQATRSNVPSHNSTPCCDNRLFHQMQRMQRNSSNHGATASK